MTTGEPGRPALPAVPWDCFLLASSCSLSKGPGSMKVDIPVCASELLNCLPLSLVLYVCTAERLQDGLGKRPACVMEASFGPVGQGIMGSQWAVEQTRSGHNSSPASLVHSVERYSLRLRIRAGTPSCPSLSVHAHPYGIMLHYCGACFFHFMVS